MNSFRFIIVILLITFTVTSISSNVYAVQMTTVLSPQLNQAEPVFTASRFITLQFPAGSELAKKYANVDQTVRFKANSSTPGMAELISGINKDISTEKQSPIRIDNATIDYVGTLKGSADRLIMSYKVVFTPSISGFTLPSNNTAGASLVDLDWRGFHTTRPLELQIPNVGNMSIGNMSINYPMSLLQVTHPELAQQVNSSQAKELFQTPLFNFDDIGTPMERWHFLFDPTGSQASTAGSGFQELGGARVVSIYSLGESSFREGVMEAKESDAKATIDGTNAAIHSSTPPPSGQIQIAGFSTVSKNGNSEVAYITANAPEGTAAATGGFPLQVLGALAGMMAAVSVFVLWKARK
ncbi:MAG TPA: hypothetical protein VFB48_01960 [Nitrososphaeraceae archaeon]|nr:hypothetical protein [Nitrososphaeraceae archaeon]